VTAYPPNPSPGTPILTQLHCHTNQSDGSFTPAQVVDKYLSAGYGALVLTDHDKVTAQPAGIASPITGNELSPAGHHILSIGASYTRGTVTDAQELIDGITAAGGHAIIAHPEWSVGMLYGEMAALTGYHGMEIHNAKVVTGAGQNPLTYPGYALERWDRLLTRSRRDIWGVATDDLHAIDAYHTYDVGRVHVFAECNTPANIMASLASGNFVADVSNHGVTPGYPVVDAEGVSLTCPGATRIEAWGPFGLQASADGNSLYLPLTGCERYVRLVATGDYFEPFDSLSDRWQAVDGTWTADGTLRVSTDGTGRRIILRRHRESGEPFRFDARIGDIGGDQAGALFNVLNGSYWYNLRFGKSPVAGWNDALAVGYTTNNSFSGPPLAAFPFVAEPGVWYTVAMDPTGGRIRAKIWERGTTEPDWQFDTPGGPWSHGAFGLRANRVGEFDNLYVGGFKTYYQPIAID
jgi:hypothetical protein